MRSLRFKLGIAFIIFGLIMPLFSLLVPFLGLPGAISACVIGFLIVGGPELCLFIGAILAGKEAVTLIKGKIFRPAGKIRYMVGLTVFVVCFLFNWVLAYLEASGIISLNTHNWLFIMAGGDITAFMGVFVMGPEFFTKIKSIFSWHGINSNQDHRKENPST